MCSIFMEGFLLLHMYNVRQVNIDHLEVFALGLGHVVNNLFNLLQLLKL